MTVSANAGDGVLEALDKLAPKLSESCKMTFKSIIDEIENNLKKILDDLVNI